MKIGKTAALVLIFLAAAGCAKKPQVEWEAFSEEKLLEAKQGGQPAVIYFSAAWCPPCYKLREETFTDPEVIDRLRPFRRFRADMSYKHSPKIIAMSEDFRLEGLPSVIFFDAQGNEAKRLVGFIPAPRFLKSVNELRTELNMPEAPAAEAKNNSPL